MSERDEKRGGAGVAIIGVALICLFLLVLYVLGIGPAARLDSQFPQPTGIPVLRAFYAPLDNAAAYRPIGNVIHWYVSFWK